MKSLGTVIAFVQPMLDEEYECLPRDRTRRPGGTLGEYRLDRVLARGGMGTVYEAHHLRLGSRVALKVPLDGDDEQPSSFESFRSEARFLGQVDHPNVVRMLDLDEDEQGPFLVLEYLDGETAADRLKRTGPLALGEAMRVICAVAAALEQVHARGIVHGDLKPANVFLVRTRREEDDVKLLDFGASVDVACSVDGDQAPPSYGGTRSYMAPEQLLGSAELDHRADQFSLAAMTYELLTGQKAFREGARPPSTALAGGPLSPVSKAVPEAPAMLDVVLARAASFRAVDRYPDIATFAAALRDALDEDLVGPSSDAPASIVRARALPGYATGTATDRSLCA